MKETAIKTAPNTPETPIKHRAYAILSQGGLSTKEISQAFGVTRGRVSQIKAKVAPLSLVSPSTTRSAHKVVKLLMKGKAFGDIQTVKDSTALAAAQTVLDRAEPKVNHNVNLNVMADFTEVDLSIVGGGAPQEPPPEPIDVKPIKVKNKVKNYTRCDCGGMKGHRGPHRTKWKK